MPVQYGGEVNFEQKELTTGKYELNKLTSREGSASVNITTAGGNESTFEIPTRPLNLARSVLRFTYKPTGNGAGQINRIAMDCLSMIRSIELRTRSGEYLCNLLHVGNYTKMVWKPEIAYEMFKALDNHGDGSGSGSMIQKCNVSNQTSIIPSARVMTNFGAANVAGTALVLPEAAVAGNAVGDITAALNTAVGNIRTLVNQPALAAQRHDSLLNVFNQTGGSYVNVAYDEAKYFESGAANTETPVINVKLPLSMLFGTIFELDKTIGFNEILDMRIVWESTNRCIFFSGDANNIGGASTATANGATVSNLNLFLAVETDPMVVRGIQDRIAGQGLNIMTEYPHAYKTALQTESQNFVIKFNRAQGERIRRIYTSAFNSTESKTTAFDNDNRSDGVAAPDTASKKINTYYTTLDGTRLQQFDVRTLDNEDYMILKDKLKGSAILNSDVYHYNWFHVDTWDNNRPLHDKDQNEKSGLSLDVERRWEFVGTVRNTIANPAPNLNHYTYMIAQRTFTVKGNDIIRS